jgi:hypothetical protein
MTDHKAPYLPPAEIDALRLKAFRTNNANDIAAYNRQVSLYFQYRMDRELDRSYRIEKLEAENKLLNSFVAGVIADTGDDPEIMAASRAEWAARALEAEAKLAKVQARLEEIVATDTQAWALRALADIKGDTT